MAKILMQTFGLVPSYSSSNAYTLLLSESGGVRKLPIIIGEHEAQAIAMELENIKPIRPLTHDLLKMIAESFQIKVTEVYIESFTEGIFYSRIFLTDGHTESTVDARTSDAIVLALKFQAPVYADQSVLEAASVIFEEIKNDEKPDDENDFYYVSTDELRHLLKDAEEREEYEVASKIMMELERRKEQKTDKK